MLRNAATSVPLKYQSNFWKSLEMPLINCKVEMKLIWTSRCVLFAAGADNDDANPNNVKDTKLCVHTKKLSILLSKGFERLVYWNKYKTKIES